MSKSQDIMLARNEGIEFALNIVKEQGIEALEEEVKFRNESGFGKKIDRKTLQAMREATEGVAIETLLINALNVLGDKFDFTSEQLNKFNDEFMNRIECIYDDYAEWKDFIDALEKEYSLELKLKYLKK